MGERPYDARPSARVEYDDESDLFSSDAYPLKSINAEKEDDQRSPILEFSSSDSNSHMISIRSDKVISEETSSGLYLEKDKSN